MLLFLSSHQATKIAQYQTLQDKIFWEKFGFYSRISMN